MGMETLGRNFKSDGIPEKEILGKPEIMFDAG